jgi:hypothetical protein
MLSFYIRTDGVINFIFIYGVPLAVRGSFEFDVTLEQISVNGSVFE